MVNLNFTSISSSGKSNIYSEGINYFICDEIIHDNVNISEINSGDISLYYASYRANHKGSTLNFCNFCYLYSECFTFSNLAHLFRYCNLCYNNGSIEGFGPGYYFRNCNLVSPDNMISYSLDNDNNHAIDCYINDIFLNKVNGRIDISNSHNTSVQFMFAAFDPNQFKTAPPKITKRRLYKKILNNLSIKHHLIALDHYKKLS